MIEKFNPQIRITLSSIRSAQTTLFISDFDTD